MIMIVPDMRPRATKTRDILTTQKCEKFRVLDACGSRKHLTARSLGCCMRFTFSVEWKKKH